MPFISNKFSILPEVKLKQDVFLEGKPIVFVHISKTGGTNINYLTFALLSKKELKYIGFAHSCDVHQSANVITKGCISGIKFIQKNPAMFDLRNKEQMQFISAHMPLPMEDYFKKDVSYISIVRDPLDRAISLANYLYQGGSFKIHELKNLLLNLEIDNLQTRWIAGEDYMKGDCTEETFAKAVKNIQEVFTIVAPIEEIEVVISMITSHFGFNDVAYTRANISKPKVVSKEDKQLCQQILERNLYDTKLYEYVKNHWELWKQSHIESISDNVVDGKKYETISPLFSSSILHINDKEIYSMDLEELKQIELNYVGELSGTEWR